MLIRLKDGFKPIGMAVVSACAVFACTFMLNFYLDVVSLRDTVLSPDMLPLYDAQVAMAKLCVGVTGGALAATAIVMLLFYVKTYLDGHTRELGILKALGYSRIRLSSAFTVFGASVLLGCALGFAGGYAVMPVVYKTMTEGLLSVSIGFHIGLPFGFVLAPPVVTAGLSWLYAYILLKRPVHEMLCGKETLPKRGREETSTRSFLSEMRIKSVTEKKTVPFFVTFACFCFAAMVQMSLSMTTQKLSSGLMGNMIFVIGVTLAVTSMLMAVSTLMRHTAKNIALMKAFGYTVSRCAFAVFGGYVPFLFLGFGIGTAYQYGLLTVMVNLIFKNVAITPTYTFDVPVFFITLAAFIVCVAVLFALYTLKIAKMPLQSIMDEK